MRRPRVACFFLVLVSAMALAKSDPVPLINQPLVPTTVAPGSKGFTLTINGTGFASDAVVNWNGSPRVTSVISSSQVQAIINAADVAEPGTASVTVTNPEKRNRTSNLVFFPVRKKSSKVAFSIDPHLSAPGSVAVGDFNNDGKLDVAIGNTVGKNSYVDVYLGNGDGTFRKPVRSTVTGFVGFTSMVPGDLNNDGKLDLLVGSGNESAGVVVAVLLGDGTGKFKQGASYYGDTYGGFLAVGDLNGDGNLDFVVTGEDEGELTTITYLGNGDGTFQQKGVTDDGYFLPVLGDFNGDGKLDLAVPDGIAEDSVDVCLGNGDGTFQACSTYDTKLYVTAVTAADLKGDGKLDLITDGVAVLLNNGEGTFTLGTTVPLDEGDGSPIGLGDFNGDGKLDVAVLTGYSQPSLAILLGAGDGTFNNPIWYSVGGANPQFTGLGLGDFDSSGELGVAVAGSNGTVLFQQSTASMSPPSLSFGNQNVGTRSQPQTDTLTNIGSSSLPIEKIEITGADAKDFAQTNNCPTSLPAGKSCGIKVTFKPTQAGPLSAFLSVSYQGSGSPALVPLSGTGVAKGTVKLTPSKLAFATQVIGTVSSPQIATLTNTSNQVVDISDISTTGPFQQANNCPSNLEPTESCQIQVKFDPQAKGPASGKLSVADDATGSPQTVALSGTATAVKLSPEGVNFGDQKVGTKSSPVPVTLANEGKTSLSISQIAITGKDAEDFVQKNNCGSSLPPKGKCTISVTFDPTAKGERSAAITVSDDGGGSPQVVSLAGTGT